MRERERARKKKKRGKSIIFSSTKFVMLLTK